MEVQDLETIFPGARVPKELIELVSFEQNELGGQFYYCQGFELIADTDKAGLRTYSEEPDFLDGLVEFAQADGTGSTYALWLGADRKASPSQVPVVVFGSEGGYHLVAANLGELLQILTCDAEPMVDWDGVSYFVDEGKEASEGNHIFQSWLSNKLGLDPVGDADAVVVRAQKKHGQAFSEWMARYCGESG